MSAITYFGHVTDTELDFSPPRQAYLPLFLPLTCRVIMFGNVLKTSVRCSRSIQSNLTQQAQLLRPSLSKTLVSSQQVAWRRFLSDDVRAKIHQAVHEKPVVLFMKGTPDMPQCGFSRAAIQVLSMWQVPPEKMKTYDVLADNELRNSIKEYSCVSAIPQGI